MKDLDKQLIGRLSVAEGLILNKLSQNVGNVVSRDDLHQCWGERYVSDGSLNIAIKNIRRELKSVGLNYLIYTRPKKGYMLIEKHKTGSYSRLEDSKEYTAILPSMAIKSIPLLIGFLLGSAILTTIIL
ncbi:winged helix-turn-helix domain-containing protein [Vibrio mediterranei]|nr:winged helix-turn-helix domain-containing protein [Vibrio mediterranei]